VLGILLWFVGYAADWFQERKILTTGQGSVIKNSCFKILILKLVRRYFNCTAFVSQTIFMMLAAYQQNRVLIILFITLGASLGALSICGYGVNHLDLGPQYASVIMGLDNTIATIPGKNFVVTKKNLNFSLNYYFTRFC
jgi:ACS family sodium-dependent inorganic phosphate cotransporter